MGSLFSTQKKPPSRVTQQDEAVLQLKTQRDKLKMYTKKIEINLEKERMLAKQLVAEGHKAKALSLLKKKRYQETLIERTAGQLANIEQLIHDVEFSQVEMEVLEKLKLGNDALHKIHKMISVEDAERIMDETKEAVEYQQEIDSIVSRELSRSDVEECEEELAALLRDNGILPQLDQLPDVPKDALPKAKAPREKAPSQGHSLSTPMGA